MSISSIQNVRVQTVVNARHEVANAENAEQDAVEASLDEQLAMPHTETQLQSNSTLGGFLLGDTSTAAPVAEGSTLDLAMQNGDFPPSLEEILVSNPNATNYLDIIVGKYEKTLERLAEMKSAAQEALLTGKVSSNEARQLQNRLSAIDSASTKTQQQIAQAQQRMSANEELYQRERMTGEDGNGDGWIGRPNSDLSVRVIINKEGKKVYLDPKMDKVIRNPFLASNYQAQISFGQGLKLANDDGKTPVDTDNPDVFENGRYKDLSKKPDLFLQVNENEEAIASGDFGVTSEIGVPEFMWVEREKGSSEAKIEHEHGTRFALYNQFEQPAGADGIVQKVPADEDKKNYTQVKVTEVKVTNEVASRHENGNEDAKLYHHVVEYYGTVDGNQVLLARVRIEGVSAELDGAQVTETNNGGYLSSSTLGFALTGKAGISAGGRVSQVVADLSEMKSTGAHLVENLANKFRAPEAARDMVDSDSLIEGPSQDAKAYSAWKENILPWTSENQSHEFYLSLKEMQKYLAPSEKESDELNAFTYSVNLSPEGVLDSDLAKENLTIEQLAAFLKEHISSIPGQATEYNEDGTVKTAGFSENIDNVIPFKITATRNINYNGSADRYVTVADDEVFKNALHNSSHEQRSGAIVTGLTGRITGSNYRDIFDIPDHDKDFKNEHPDSPLKEVFGERPQNGDAEYNTIIDGGNSHDIVRARNGNIIADNITFFWQDSTNESHSIVGMEAGSSDLNGMPDAQSDIKTYVHQSGPGTLDVLNAQEIGSSEDKNSPFYHYITSNDYYDVQNAEFANKLDADVPENMKNGHGFAEDHISTAITEIEADLDEAIRGMPQLDEADMAQAAADWNLNYGKNYTEMESELGQFFGEMFGNEEEDQAFAEEQLEVEEERNV